MTQEEWNTEAVRRFGHDFMMWTFLCPGCQHVQSVADFKPFKEQGATPDAAYSQCLGRFLPRAETRSWTSDRPTVNDSRRCDYAAFGLFRIAPVHVDGVEYPIFAFAESRRTEGD